MSRYSRNKRVACTHCGDSKRWRQTGNIRELPKGWTQTVAAVVCHRRPCRDWAREVGELAKGNR